MFFTRKQLILLLTIFIGVVFTTEGTTIKRDLDSPLRSLQLGSFGPISKLPIHPTFAHLGLTPLQSVGVMQVLLENGFFGPYVLKMTNGRPPHPVPRPYFGAYEVDPYTFFILSNYPKYLPFGLGSLGIYGSTGLPKIKPQGVFKYEEKN